MLAAAAACALTDPAAVIDPVTMADSVLLAAPAARDFGDATSVLVRDGELWLATTAGDRVARAAPAQ